MTILDLISTTGILEYIKRFELQFGKLNNNEYQILQIFKNALYEYLEKYQKFISDASQKEFYDGMIK